MTKWITITTLLAMAVGVPFATQAEEDPACLSEVRALFDGPLDPFERPPHTKVLEVYSPEGTLLRVSDTRIQTPLRQITGFRGSGQFMLMVGRDAWMGETMEGPWTAMGQMMTEDMEAAQRQMPDSMAANLSEVECPGVVETTDGPRQVYRFRTKVDPHPARGNSWWGAFEEVWMDPDTGLPVRWELTEHIASWQEGVNAERHVAVATYDDSLTVIAPE